MTTNLSRRRFFGLLGGAAATYFLPPIGGWKSEWKSDVIVNPGEIYGWFFVNTPLQDLLLRRRSLGPPVSELLFAHREMFVVEGFKQ